MRQRAGAESHVVEAAEDGDDNAPMDLEEQERILEEFRISIHKTNLLHRATFAILGVCIAIMVAWHAMGRARVDQAYLLYAAAHYAACSYALWKPPPTSSRRSRAMLWGGLCAAGAVVSACAFWRHSSLGSFPFPEAAWHMFGNLAFMLCAFYVHNSCEHSLRELAHLEKEGATHPAIANPGRV